MTSMWSSLVVLRDAVAGSLDDPAMLDATRPVCQCFVNGILSPDGCCVLLGVFGVCVACLLILR